jgi:hypothetical protein
MANYDDPSDAVRVALEVLDRLGGAESSGIYEPRLNAVLQPLRALPAIEVCCGRDLCRARIGWWAIDHSVAYIAATQERAKPKRRLGGMSDLAEPQPRRNAGLLPWIELAESGKTRVRLVDWKNASGFPLRLSFHCRCGAEYVTRNTTRLRLFLSAAAAGTGTIFLT